MNDLNIQIADLSAPFPAMAFEKELVENGIRFRKTPKTNGDGGLPSEVYYIRTEDVERTRVILEGVEKENAVSEEKFSHPFRKILAYIGLIFIVIYLVYALVEAIS